MSKNSYVKVLIKETEIKYKSYAFHLRNTNEDVSYIEHDDSLAVCFIIFTETLYTIYLLQYYFCIVT